jgi:V/A-type H+-transporting ATPase subunit E
MSLENILNEIDSTTQSELKNIKDEYSAKIEAIKKSCDDKITRIKDYYAVKSDSDVKNIIKQYEDNIRLQSKQIIDEKKKELLTNTMQKLKSYVTSLNKSSNYPELLKTMVEESKKELGKSFIVYCGEIDNEKLQSFKFPDSIKFIVDKSIKSGIIAISPDGKKEIDMRLSSIFDGISYDVETYLYENIK